MLSSKCPWTFGRMKWHHYDQQLRVDSGYQEKNLGEIDPRYTAGACACSPATFPVPPIQTKQLGMYGKRGQQKEGPGGKELTSSFKHSFEELCPRKEEECWFNHVHVC